MKEDPTNRKALGNYLSTHIERDQYFYGKGKILLSGEYFILDGACSIALPTALGQSLSVKYRRSFDPKLYWKALDSKGNTWFEATFEFWHFSCLDHKDNAYAKKLEHILNMVRSQNKHFLRDGVDVFVETKLEFPMDWGLGSSSSLIYNIAQWAYISPFELLSQTFGGSGYDIACAQAVGPIIFKKVGTTPTWSQVEFNPVFKENLYFVHLEKKQSTSEAIEFYRRASVKKNELAIKLTDITKNLLKTNNLEEFEFLIAGHEKIVANALEMTRVKQKYFDDFWGEVKSLGAWGGDLVLATSTRGHDQTCEYFKSKGFPEVIAFNKLVELPERAVSEVVKSERVLQ